MSDHRSLSHHADSPVEDRFLAWTDDLVDPDTGAVPSPDSDFAGVADTASTVQRSAGAGATMPLSMERAETMWKDLMNTTTATPNITPALPGSDNAPSSRSSRISVAPPAGWRAYLTTGLLVAAILLAGIATIWQIRDPFSGGESGPANQPGIAGSASPAAVTQCDLTNDIPVFVDTVPDAPFIETHVLLAEDGTLTLNCDGTSEKIATGVEQVVPTWWPGAIAVAMQDGTVQMINLANGATAQLEAEMLLDELGRFIQDRSVYVSAQHSPWLVTVANDDRTDWRVTDLRTMESFLLSEEIGKPLEEPHIPVFLVSQISAALTFVPEESASPSSSHREPAPFEPISPEGTALLLPGSIEDRRWLDVPIGPSNSPLPTVTVSRDGSLIAYPVSTDSDEQAIRVEQTLDGALVAEVPFEFDTGEPLERLYMLLAGSEPSLVLSDGSTIEVVTWEPEIERITVDSGLQQPTRIAPTADPDVVFVSQTGGGVPVNIATGTAGDSYRYARGSVQFVDGARYITTIVNIASDAVSGVPSTIQIVDPVTGEVLIESDPIDQHPLELSGAGALVSLERDGSLAVASVDPNRAFVLDATTGETWEISRPADGVERWLFIPSRDGRLVYAISRDQYVEGDNAPFYMAALTPNAEWVEVSDASIPRYIVGTHDLPDGGDDEPAVLDAQEITPLGATPAATPASPAAREQVPLAPVSTPLGDVPAPEFQLGDCDLTQDIPVFTNIEEAPLDRLALLLNDGELWLRCGGDAAALIEKGVTGVRSTGWPGAIVLTMDDGILRGVNLVTGARGDLGPETVLTESVAGDDPFSYAPGAPWLGIPANPEMTDWRFVDLRTMDSMLLSDEIGGVLPRSTVTSLYAFTPDAAVIGFPGTPVNAGAPPTNLLDRDGPTPLPSTPTSELPAENAALVIDGSLGNRRWTDVSGRGMNPVSISPDGELLAIEQMTDTGPTVRVERLSGGEIVAETGITLGGADSMLLLNDGLLHLAEDRLDLVTWDGEVAVETLLDTVPNQQSHVLVQSADPDVSIVSPQGPTGATGGYLVNAATGETTETPNLMPAPHINPNYIDAVRPRYVLSVAPQGTDDAQSTVRLIDVTTGEIAVESDALDMAPTDLAARDAALRDGATLGLVFLPDGRIVVLDAAAGASYGIEPPGLEGASGNIDWLFFPSPGGTFVSVTPAPGPDAPVFIRAITPDAEWTEVPQGSRVSFVPGPQALPEQGHQGD